MSGQARTAVAAPQPDRDAIGAAAAREAAELVALFAGLNRAAWAELGSLDKGARAITGTHGDSAKAD